MARTLLLSLLREETPSGMTDPAERVEVVSTTVVNWEPSALDMTVVWKTVVRGILRVVLLLFFVIVLVFSVVLVFKELVGVVRLEEEEVLVVVEDDVVEVLEVEVVVTDVTEEDVE